MNMSGFQSKAYASRPLSRHEAATRLASTSSARSRREDRYTVSMAARMYSCMSTAKNLMKYRRS